MNNILGIKINVRKKLVYSQTAISGIGLTFSKKIMNKFLFSYYSYPNQYSQKILEKIGKYIKENFLIENMLKDTVSLNIQRLIMIGSRRGLRHQFKLPVRGQRSHTNAQTIKKKKK